MEDQENQKDVRCECEVEGEIVQNFKNRELWSIADGYWRVLQSDEEDKSEQKEGCTEDLPEVGAPSTKGAEIGLKVVSSFF